MLQLILGFTAMGITTWLYCEFLFARKGSLGAQVVSFCVGYLAVAGFYCSNWGWFSILPFFAVNCFALWQCYHCAPKTAVLHAAFLTFGMIFTRELAFLAVEYAPGVSYSPFDLNSDTVLPWQLYYLVLCVLGALLFKPHKQAYQEPGMMALLCAAPVISGAVSMLLLFMGARQELSAWAKSMVAIGEGALLAVNLILFALYNHLEKAHASNLELQLSIQQEQSDAAYYQVLRDQSESQKILIHDIKNHLHTLDALAQQADNGEIRAYLQNLETSLGQTFHPRLSAEPILDAVLQRTKEECRQKGITFYCDVRQGCTGFMDAPSITALYGNLLSNAVEGAEGSRGRTVELRVTNHNQGIVISLVNDCDTAPRTDNFGRLVTKKLDPQTHGVGLKSIERVVRRYSGIQTVYYDDQNRQFHHVIHFPQYKI